eukprot:TRINITY_DN51301_c0_g1_i1.p1 TRINITY_DN51301_c0_g1~~TRINITY_DN51301_c0_g1_i1.p1  ORF type:complete len:235 (+),score=70.54 TRINITY_DN51301_c0_g1_i1:76-780(+)
MAEGGGRRGSGSSGKVTLYCYGFKGRAHYVNMCVAYVGRWGDIDWIYNLQEIEAAAPGGRDPRVRSVFGQVPCMVDADVRIGQTLAILRYLLRKYNFGFDAPLSDYAISEQMIEQAKDIHEELHHCQHNRLPGFKTSLEAYRETLAHYLPRNFAAFEQAITASGWFGGQVMPGDVCVAALVDIVEDIRPGFVSNYPKLRKLFERVCANPGVQELRQRMERHIAAGWQYWTRVDS